MDVAVPASRLPPRVAAGPDRRLRSRSDRLWPEAGEPFAHVLSPHASPPVASTDQRGTGRCRAVLPQADRRQVPAGHARTRRPIAPPMGTSVVRVWMLLASAFCYRLPPDDSWALPGSTGEAANPVRESRCHLMGPSGKTTRADSATSVHPARPPTRRDIPMRAV